jgi:aminoglycoside/choline kinase family phosphotransferase
MTIEESLKELYKEWSGETALMIVPLSGAGSGRKYYRISGKTRKAVGVFNADPKENDAFIGFSEYFKTAGLPVPSILKVNKGAGCYLLDDLGDTTLFSFFEDYKVTGEGFTDKVVEMYRKVIRWLPQFQVKCAAGIDYSLCYPRPAFDRQSILWDMNYFKYYFLKLAKVPFDEQRLEDDFQAFASFILEADPNFFMYRDFQSRNIMIVNDNPVFIDYQGGRRGPLQYDIASLLYDAKADIPEPARGILLDNYLEVLSGYHKVDKPAFRKYYYGIVVIRILQALGAYGLRGYYENKPHFLKSIPFAMRNLRFLLDSGRFIPGLPMLEEVVAGMVNNSSFSVPETKTSNLVVSIFSFSYKDQIPGDKYSNGGGFVFDCRALPNPGRHEEYQHVTGKDRKVIDFLKKEPAIDEFLNHVTALTDQSIKIYMERGFSNLMVSFGCTGGQHRSVYCAEYLAQHIREKFPVTVNVRHTETERKEKRQ